jgi:HSP20 family protein
MAIRRWDPWSELTRLQNELSRMFQRAFGPVAEEGMPWLPATDVYEKENKIIVTMDLPEVDPKDIDVSVVDNTLKVKGERKHIKEVEEENYIREERMYGKFERIIDLPVSVKTEEVEATYKDGVLTITLPEAEAKKGKEIEVKVA